MSTPSPLSTHIFALAPKVLRSGHGVTWLSYLGLDEQQKAAEFRSADDATNFAAQHALMRAIAATALDVRPTKASEIPVDRTCKICGESLEHGKPRISGVNVNMARSNGMAVGAFINNDMTDGALLLGVDIERLRGGLLESFDQVLLTDAEQERMSLLSEDSARIFRLLLWNAKEAVLKATGHGLPAGLQNVSIDCTDLPQQIETIDRFSTRARLALEGTRALDFWIRWHQLEEYFIAVATSQPLDSQVHQVSTPLELKRLMSSLKRCETQNLRE